MLPAALPPAMTTRPPPPPAIVRPAPAALHAAAHNAVGGLVVPIDLLVPPEARAVTAKATHHAASHALRSFALHAARVLTPASSIPPAALTTAAACGGPAAFPATRIATGHTYAAILPRMEMEERAYWVAWARTPGVGPVRMRRLQAAFGTLGAAWGASLTALRAAGLDERTAASAIATFGTHDPATGWEQLARRGIGVTTRDDDDYPRLLREIPYAPAVLFVRGTLTAADDLAVAVVGTRRATAYGREAARTLAAELGATGVTVVSGLAKGIDGIAHTAALDGGGRTIAVLAHGLDTVYPREHTALAARIADGGGAVVSEYPPGTRPDAPNFPARNRIISGLALGTLIVEADRRSGAMITADFAADQGREVLAVPGSILNPLSAGCHALLRDGAHLVAETGDILVALQLETRQAQQATQQELPTLPGVPGAEAVLHALSAEPLHIDDLCRASGLAMSDLNGLLVQLQLTGAIRAAGPQLYVRA